MDALDPGDLTPVDPDLDVAGLIPFEAAGEWDLAGLTPIAASEDGAARQPATDHTAEPSIREAPDASEGLPPAQMAETDSPDPASTATQLAQASTERTKLPRGLGQNNPGNVGPWGDRPVVQGL